MSFASTAIAVTPVLFILLLIPILIGVYVYRDAGRRGMNAVLWTLVAILAPSLIGFIIYLLVRNSYSTLKCPQCDAPVTEQYIACPQCGIKLRASCPSCAAPIEPDWMVCPRCTQPLTDYHESFAAPVRPKDKGLGKILLAVILIPLVVILLMFTLFSFTGSESSLGSASMSIDYYLETCDADVSEWLLDLPQSTDTAYVLEYKTKQNGQKFTQYLVYFAPLTAESSYSLGSGNNPFKNVVQIDIEASDITDGESVLLITSIDKDYAELKITYAGKKVNCEIAQIDLPLDPDKFLIMSEDEATFEETKILK
ncbi:MAG: zinc ribbon domain-containing protein [Lachnospiraceae bacterium]|nr:zinc ribbon domain-containing protein [Lachnospiraceae bacterium]